MATWDDSESSEAESDSEDTRANIALMANIVEDADSSESKTEEVLSHLTKFEL